MGEHDQKSSAASQNHASDDLDRILDAALAKFAPAEPRPGLEDRVLANLRAEQDRATSRAWWQWSLAALASAVVLLAVASVWWTGAHKPPVAIHPVVPAGTRQEYARQSSENTLGSPNVRRPTRRSQRHHSPPDVVAAPGPKLDQFPSPQPLTEQERILASYVARFHDQAVLVARLADQELEKDRTAVFGNPQNASGSGEQNQQTSHP